MKNNIFIKIIFFCLLIGAKQNMCAQNSESDSLTLVLKSSKEDTIQVNTLLLLSRQLSVTGNIEKCLFFSNQALNLSEKLNFKKGITGSLRILGDAYSDQGNFEKGISYYLKALKIAEEINDIKSIGKLYHNIGSMYLDQGNYVKALENFTKSLGIFTKLGAKPDLARSNIGIGIVYASLDNYDKALEHYFKALKIYEEAMDKQGYAATFNNIGNIYSRKGNLKLALENFFNALKIKTEIGDKRGIVICKINIGSVYFKQNNYEMSDLYLSEALALSDEIGYKLGKKEIYSSLAALFEKKLDFKKALIYHKLFSDIKDTLLNEASSKQITEINTKYDTEKKDKELIRKDAEISVQQAEFEKQQAQRNVFIIGFILMLGLAFFIFKSYRQKKAANILLEIKNETISKQNSEIEKKNAVITDSIEYAKNIQQAILPENEEIKRSFENYFIFYEPKDIVSGDFYWANHNEEKALLAVVDCTGHGVSGAFMSLMGANLLNNIITASPELKPSEILEELNRQVLKVLKQKDKGASAKFGMDIALISVDKQSGKLEFSGAHNPLLIFRNRELIELKATNYSIGSYITKDFKGFANNEFQLKEGDILYLFTDGYYDQLGGPENKKFYSRTFRELLHTICLLDMDEQKEILTKTITSWKGKKNQTDDMLIVGVKYFA